MRPTFLGFETARMGMMVAQKGLDVTGHNLTNVKTAGYTRQRIDLYSVAPAHYQSRLKYDRTQLAGQGVNAYGISQVRDQFLDKRFREEYSDVGYYDQTSAILSDIESALDEFKTDKGLDSALSQIESALIEMTKNGASKTQATVIRTAFENIVQVLHQMDTKLKNVAEQQKFDLDVAVKQMNQNLSKIADLNQRISEDMTVTKATNGEYYGPNELLDERNLLLDDLARFGDLETIPQPDGSITVKMNGKTVVDYNEFDTINMQRFSNGTVALNWQSTGEEVKMTTGALKGYTDMINGRGYNAHQTNEVTANGIRYYQDRLDAFARTLAETANGIIPTKDSINPEGEVEQEPVYETNPDGTYIKDADGNYKPVYVKETDENGKIKKDKDGNDIYKLDDNGQKIPLTRAKNVKYCTLLQSVTLVPEVNEFGEKTGKMVYDTSKPVTAENISVSGNWNHEDGKDLWTEDATYIIPAEGVNESSWYNEMLSALRDKDHVFKSPVELGDGMFNGSFPDFIVTTATLYGTQLSSSDSRLEASATIADELLNRRDEISAVAPDEETANMLLYNKSYQAAARLMTSLDDMLDVLINRTGRVGL